MEILPIRTKADYRRTLKEIETLMDAVPKSQKGERLDVLVALARHTNGNISRSTFPTRLRRSSFAWSRWVFSPRTWSRSSVGATGSTRC